MDEPGQSKKAGLPPSPPGPGSDGRVAGKTRVGIGLPPKLAASMLGSGSKPATQANTQTAKIGGLVTATGRASTLRSNTGSETSSPLEKTETGSPKPGGFAPPLKALGVARPLAAKPLGATQPLTKPLRPSLAPAPALATQATAARVTPRAQVEPAVLAIGTDDAILPGLKIALARHGVFVESADAPSVVDAVVAAAPDLILLLGEAAKDWGRATLEKLAASPQSSVVPVALIDDNMALNARLQAFRHGATAVIPRSASIDAIAEKVARLAKEIPDRGTDSPHMVGEATLEEFVDALRSELRTGILSVQAAKAPPEQAIRLMLGGGKLLADFLDDFVRRVRAHVVSAEPLTYEFDERAGGTLGLLGGDSPRAAADVSGLRLALADDDAARADAVAQELRSHGAKVFVTDLAPTEARLAKLRQLDPAVLLIGETQLKGAGYELIRRMRRDTRLRWASLLVLRWEELFKDQGDAPIVDQVSGTLATLVEPERSLLERATGGKGFDTRLETTGPARLLKALASCPRALRLSVYNPRLNVSIDLAEGLIVGATAQVVSPVAKELSGPLALAAFLVLSSGRVHVEQTSSALQANLMATVDVAINLAEAEPPPIAPSIPAPSRSVEPALASLPAPSKLPDFQVAGPPSSVEAIDPPLSLPDSVSSDAFLEQDLLRAVTLRPKAVKDSALGWRAWVMLSALACVQVALVIGIGVVVVKHLSGSAAKAGEVRVTEHLAAVEVNQKRSQPSLAARTESADITQPSNPEANTKPAVAESKAILGALPLPKPSSTPSCEDLEKSVKPLRGALPLDAAGALRLGHKLLVLGNVEDTQTAFCQAIALDPENPKAQLALAQLLVLRGDGKFAASVARRALELHAEPARAKGLLGDALITSGDLAGARQAWLDAAGITHHDSVGVAKLASRARSEGAASVGNKDYSRAERFFWRTLAFFEQDFGANLGMARAHLFRGNNPLAAEWARRATQIAPDDARARLVYGDALMRTGDRNAAVREWQEAFRLDPRSGEAKIRLEE